jgi:hypothetical protein
MAINKTTASYNRNTRGLLHAYEINDCVVLAFTVAAQIDYAVAHQLCRKHGRVDRKGTSDRTVHAVAKELGATNIDRDLTKGQQPAFMRGTDWPTLQQFIGEHSIGRYFIIRGGHAFAVIDGVVHDWEYGTGARTRVYMAYKF